MARKLWFRRNEYVFNEIFTHPNALLREVWSSAEAFLNINGDAQAVEQRSNAILQATWKATVDGWHKANWGAALDPSNGHLGVGIVIYDQVGGVLATKCMHMQGHMEPS